MSSIDAYFTWEDEDLDGYLLDLYERNGGGEVTRCRLLQCILYELRALRQRQERTDANLEAVFRPATPEE